MGSDKISTSLVECERVKAKIGKALRADGSPPCRRSFVPRADKRVSSPNISVGLLFVPLSSIGVHIGGGNHQQE